MKNKSTLIVWMLLIIVGVPNCGKVVDWAKSNVPQGKDVKKQTEGAKQYVRSVSVYKKFETQGIFDALWLSDQVRTTYANMHSYRRGESDEQHNLFLRRQLEENKHFITFYVLSLYEFPFGNPDSIWEVFLSVNGNFFRPVELKAVDIVPEYRAIFGKHLTRFKEVYQVKFDAKDIDDELLITPETQKIILHFRSLDKETELTWYLDEQGNATTKRAAKKRNNNHKQGQV